MRAGDCEIGAPAGPDEREQYAAIVVEALEFPPLAERDWLSRYDPADIRVARVGGRVVAGAVLVRCGQWFGGRRVPAIGVHAVGVLPEARGCGVGGALMRHLVGDMRAAGAALSCLYPATQPVYRAVGYELAGSWTWYELATRSIELRDRTLEVERLAPAGTPERARQMQDVCAAYQAFARAQSGLLDRNALLWGRVVDPVTTAAQAFLVRQDGQVTGYVALVHGRHARTNRYDLYCRDLVATTPEAARRLLTLLADHRSMSPVLLVPGPPGLAQLLPVAEAELRVEMYLRWMLRVLDVAAALEARGYAPGLSARLSMTVRDDALPDNVGRYVLSVADGRGRVRGPQRAAARDADADRSDSDIDIDVRGLAALYTGFATASELAWAGLARGTPEALARASALFAGPPPWMPEVF